MFKNININNIFSILLIIAILLAIYVLVNKYIYIFEGMSENKSRLDREIEKEEKIMENYDLTEYDDKIEKTVKLFDLQIKKII